LAATGVSALPKGVIIRSNNFVAPAFAGMTILYPGELPKSNLFLRLLQPIASPCGGQTRALTPPCGNS
jgi:hypothetical protein